MRYLAVFFTLIFGAMGFAETYEQEWGQTAAPNPAWSPTAAGSCKKIGLTVIPGMYYDGQFFEKAVQAKGLSATCFDSYGNTVWVDLWCKITKDDGTISRYRGYCHGPANYCGANEKGNPIDVYSRIKRETSVDWTSTKDARFSIERSYLSNGELSLGTNSNYNRLGHAGVWRSSFNEIVRYTRSIKKHVFYRKDGSRIYFNKDYTPIHPQNKIDFKFTDYDWTGPWTLLGTDKSGLTRIFDSRDPWDRYLKGLKWPDGYQINIDRAHGKILAIRDNRGQRAEFTWQNDTVLGSTREVITKIEIDTDYEGTFSPDVRIDYAYEPNTRQETVPILAEVTRTDISSGNSELAYRYTYHKDANDKPYYPLLLAEVYDGRLDAQGDPTLYAQFEYNIDGTTVDGGPNQSSSSNIFTVNTPFGYTIRPAISTTHVGAETYQVQGDFDDPNAPSRKVINPLGHVTEYDFAKSADRLLTSSEKGLATPHCLGTTLSREFTPNTGAPEGFVYAQVERNGSRTTFERDSIGRILVKTEDADGVDPQVTTYTWAGETHRLATRTTAQMTEAFSYTPTGLLTQYSQTDALTGSPDHGKTRTWDYSYVTYSSGLTVLRSVDGPGLVADGVYDVTTYHYDSKGNLTKLIDPNKLETEIVARDALGQPALVRDPYGVKWAFSYDINGRITSVTRNPGVAGSNTSAYAYDPVGQLTSYTNFNGDTWSFEYDQARRMSRTVNPFGDAVSYRHDAMGNVTRVEYSDGTSAATFWEDTEFDKLGRLLKTIGAEGQAWQYRHDVENNMDMVTDPTSLATNHSFDALNRLVGVVDRAGYTSLNEHDHANQLTKFTDQRSIDTTFTYNGFGEVLSEASADRGSLFYTYNNRGLVASMTDARGVVSNYEYDDGGRLTGRSFPSDPTQDQSFSYALGEGALSSSLEVTSINGQAISSGASITLASGADVELLTDGSLRYSQNGMFGALDDGQTATDSFVYSVTNTWGATEDSNISVSVDGVTYPTPDRALSLAATPFVDIGDVTLSGEFTVESWVKFPAGDSISNSDSLISNGTLGQSLNFFGKRFRFWSQHGDRIIASTPAEYDTWMHYAITRDAAGQLRIYLNGVLDATSAGSYMHPLTVGTIGRVDNSTRAQFDNLRIWSIERSEAELLANMNGHVPVNSAGLERYYAFDGINALVRDETGNSADVAISDGTSLVDSYAPVTGTSPSTDPTEDYSSSLIRSLSLSNSPNVDIGDVNLAGEFTVESWVKFPAGTTINYDDTLVSDGTVNQTLNFHKGRFRFWSEKADRLIASTLSTHDTWTHYAITRDAAGILRIYINGVLDVSGSIPYMYPFSIGTIGRPTNSTTAKFDNLRIWSVERSEAELLSNMNGHVPLNSPGLERYYSFDNLNGVVVDGTGNSPNASIAANTRLTLSDSPVSESMPVVVPLQNATLSIVEGIDANFHVLDEHLNLPGSGRTDITSDASGKSYINYDSITGFPVEDFRKIEQHDYSVRYTYDADGQITSTIYPSGQAVAYVRDADGRITKITVDRGAGPVSVISGVTYLPNGPVASMTYGDGILHSASYDNSYRLTGLTDGQGASLLRDATYTWTVRDNLASVSDPINPMRNATYGYSPREFLASATGGWDTLAFTYDGVGNRLTRAATQSGTTSIDTYSYPSSSNRLQSIAGTAPRSFTYDAAGNTTYDNRQGGGYGYTYDAAGRMESFSINGVVQAEYVYNALGQQVIRRLPQDQTVFHSLFDLTGNRIAEYEVDPLTNAKTLAREYIWMENVPVAVVENGTLYFVRTDHIGRPVFATNSAGAKVWDATYLPFGGVHTTTGDPINLRFPGQWFQSESGLHQNWMRDYDPTTGRYIQADPLGLVDGASLYGYALQNPGRYIDPRGEQIALPLPPMGGSSYPGGKGPEVDWRGIGDQLAGAAAILMSLIDKLNVDANSGGSNTIPKPDRIKNKWNCICRAHKDGRSEKNCPTGPLFGFGQYADMNLWVAHTVARKIARAKISAASTHHIQCKCRGPKGQIVSSGRGIP